MRKSILLVFPVLVIVLSSAYAYTSERQGDSMSLVEAFETTPTSILTPTATPTPTNTPTPIPTIAPTLTPTLSPTPTFSCDIKATRKVLKGEREPSEPVDQASLEKQIKEFLAAYEENCQ